MDEVRKNQLAKLHRDCFNDGGYADFFFERRVEENNVFLIEENGEVLSACYARTFDLELSGKRIKVPFLTGVATNPNHRYKGHARAVVGKAKDVLKKRGYPFVLLHPFNHDFYRKLGFETFNFIKRITPTGNVAQGVTIERMNASHLDVVNDLYNSLIARRGAYRIRSLEETILLIGYSLEHGGFGYVIHENGTPKGYVWCEDGNCVYAPHGVFLCVFFRRQGFGGFGKQFYNMGFLCPPLAFAYFTKEVCSRMELYLAIILIVVALVLGLGAGVGIGVLLRKRVAEREIGSAEAEATRLINEAIRGGENRKKEMLLEAKDEIHRSRTEHEKEVKERRAELSKQERRLEQKEATLEKQRYYFANKDPSSQGYGFSSGHVWM